MVAESSQRAAGEVAVFVARPEQLGEAGHVAELLDLLSAEERERYERFRFDRHRTEFLAAHALLRTTLAGYLGCSPTELRFELAAHGKPRLAAGIAGARGAAPRFNLSHTDGMVACAVCTHAEVGVDVEHEDRRVDIAQLAPSVFSPHERHALESLPQYARRRRFFQYWTLKESYIKAVGKGLSLPLRSITFHVGAGADPRVTFEPPIEDEPQAWRFACVRVSRRHPLAVAVRQQEPLRVRLREISKPGLHVTRS